MTKPPLIVLILAVLGALVPLCETQAADQPNVLFIIADDASRHFGKAYGIDWVNTPNIDRLAKKGLIFDNAYVPTSKCAPCRAATLTGRNPWQNGQAANHQNYFPAELPAFGEALQKAGVHTGSAGKVWGPGIAEDADGNKRDFGLPNFGGRNDPGPPFEKFLEARPKDAPFFYWYGSSNPHRGYKKGSGTAAGKKPSDIDHVPAYWPDNDVIRNDMLDYAIEVEAFDSQAGELLKILEKSGEMDNTLVIVTSDHGMPFPRVKGHTFDDANRVPLVMHWPKGIADPGRRVGALVSFIDLAPTFLDVFGVKYADNGMDLTGVGMMDLLANDPQHERDFVLIGRERNDVYARRGSPSGLGYPVRGIRSGDFLYLRNFEPDRWPCGDPDLGLKDTDGSPTKSLLMDMGNAHQYWQNSFGKRPAEQLFDVVADPDCVVNLIEEPNHTETRKALGAKLMEVLKQQKDPRALGKGDVFDNYPTVKKAPKGWGK